ncbi:hypothetical protein PM082_003844 [Marasmius tenuissimus]|nr:hypothetical protein PM082_003844 [Marasmius tenuissimus]
MELDVSVQYLEGEVLGRFLEILGDGLRALKGLRSISVVEYVCVGEDDVLAAEDPEGILVKHTLALFTLPTIEITLQSTLVMSVECRSSVLGQPNVRPLSDLGYRILKETILSSEWVAGQEWCLAIETLGLTSRVRGTQGGPGSESKTRQYVCSTFGAQICPLDIFNPFGHQKISPACILFTEYKKTCGEHTNQERPTRLLAEDV